MRWPLGAVVVWTVFQPIAIFSQSPAPASSNPAGIPLDLSAESPAPQPGASPVPGAKKQPPVVEPNILDGLESLQLMLPPEGPPANDLFASPKATPPGSKSSYGFSGLAAPTLGGGGMEAPSLDPGSTALQSTAGAPLSPTPLPAEIVQAPELGTPLDQPQITGRSLGSRSLGQLSTPGFLNSKRSFALGSGRVRYGADIAASAAYNNNVFGTANNPQGDVIMSLQPSIYLETGKRGTIRFLWAPSVLKYAKYKQYDAVNQNFVFSSRYRFTKLRLGLDASYTTQSGLFLNSQGQAKQKTLFAKVFAGYPLSRKTDLLVSLEGNAMTADPGGTQFQGSFSTALDYKYSRKTTVGAGINIGYYNSTGGMTTFQTFLLRLLYNPTSKLSFSGEGGLQFRQSTGSVNSGSSGSSVVISMLMSYRPTEKTSMGLRLYRNVEVDAFSPNSLQTVTGADLSLAFKVFSRASFAAALSAGYTESMNSQSDGAGNFFFTQGTVSLSYALLQDVNVRVFNNLQQRMRDTQGQNYLSNTTGMSMGMQF